MTKNTSVSGQLEADMTTMARESRKWNLSIGLYTQSIDDIPKIIIELATTIVILGAGTDDSIKDMAERFGLNGSCRHALGHLGKPGPAGANLVALFRTGAGKSQLVLSLTIGGQACGPSPPPRKTWLSAIISTNTWNLLKPCGVWRPVFRVARQSPRWNAAAVRSLTSPVPTMPWST